MHRVNCEMLHKILATFVKYLIPITVARIDNTCYASKLIDLKCTKSIDVWMTYTKFVKEVCVERKYILNKYNPLVKLPKEYKKLRKLIECRGFKVYPLGKKSWIIDAHVDIFCATESVSIE